MVDAAHNGEDSGTREREAVMQQPAGARVVRWEGLHNGKGGGTTRKVAMQQPAAIFQKEWGWLVL